MSKYLTQEWLDETAKMGDSQPERPGAEPEALLNGRDARHPTRQRDPVQEEDRPDGRPGCGRVARARRLGHGPPRSVTGDLRDGVLAPEDDAELDDATDDEHEHTDDEAEFNQGLAPSGATAQPEQGWNRGHGAGRASIRNRATVVIVK